MGVAAGVKQALLCHQQGPVSKCSAV
jgi:hypothetical protein